GVGVVAEHLEGAVLARLHGGGGDGGVVAPVDGGRVVRGRAVGVLEGGHGHRAGGEGEEGPEVDRLHRLEGVADGGLGAGGQGAAGTVLHQDRHGVAALLGVGVAAAGRGAGDTVGAVAQQLDRAGGGGAVAPEDGGGELAGRGLGVVVGEGGQQQRGVAV